MAETIRGCLSLTLSGFAFASHDIGGFEVRDFLLGGFICLISMPRVFHLQSFTSDG